MERLQPDLDVDDLAGARDRLDVKAEGPSVQIGGRACLLGRHLKYLPDRLAARVGQHGVREAQVASPMRAKSSKMAVMTGSANGSGWIGSGAPVVGPPSGGTFKVCVLLAILTYWHDNMNGCRYQRKIIGFSFAARPLAARNFDWQAQGAAKKEASGQCPGPRPCCRLRYSLQPVNAYF
jgi:hypothetical protein